MKNLSRRERQIMEYLFAHPNALATDVQQALPGGPSNSTVRTLLRKLVEKGEVEHHSDGARYRYQPSSATDEAGSSALEGVVQTFFNGSVAEAMAGLLGSGNDRLQDDELDAIESLIEEARAKQSQRSAKSSEPPRQKQGG